MNPEIEELKTRMGKMEDNMGTLTKLMNNLVENNNPKPKHPLTEKQKKIMQLYNEGKQGKDIARDYDVRQTPASVSYTLQKLRKWGYISEV